MKSTGIVRKVDELGRIVLPIELRRTLDIEIKDSIEIYVENDSIILKKYEPTCIFCGNSKELIEFNDKNKLINFTRAIQYSSAIDSNTTLVAGDMDGYADKIIMASGSFNQGSSIELSCDGPMREPYAGFLQGCLTYQHGKIGLINAIQTLF